MSEEEIANALNIPVELLSKIGQEKIEMYIRLIQTAEALVLWQQGLGPKPEGVLICG